MKRSALKLTLQQGIQQRKQKRMLVDGSLRQYFYRLYYNQQDYLSLSRQCIYRCSYETENNEMQIMKQILVVILDLSKFIKGLMLETPLKFQGVIFKRSQGSTLMSVREDRESIFLLPRDLRYRFECTPIAFFT